MDFNQQVVGEGEALVEATLEYEPTVTYLGNSRSAGNAIQDINTLAVVLYDPAGNLVKLYNNSDLQVEYTQTTDKPEDFDGVVSDNPSNKSKATFRLPIKYGRYQMYAVANLGYDLTEEDVETPEKLKQIKCTWDFNDITKNAQMFGYFTNEDNQTSGGFEAAQPVIVNKNSVKLHAWIKRLASKVTLQYNGSGLHQGVYIYIHNVSIRQLPITCALGENNSPKNTDETGFVSTDAYLDGDRIPDTDTKSLYNSQVIFYNKDGETNNNTDQYPNVDQHENWLTIAKGSGVKGSHSATAPALYFYENMQGNYENDSDREKYNKTQNRNEVGNNVTPTDPDYKDNVPYGTFIEVEAYYQSNNADNLTDGPIRYRFMLGQNLTYDYNAIRNNHYKLTLGFNGWANQPDWHIEYYEEAPEIFVPEVYVPYLYNQSVQFPIRFNGDLQSFDMEIIENNWAPYDETQPDQVPITPQGANDFTNRTLQFAWNRTVYMNAASYTQSCPSAGLANGNSYGNNFLYGRHLSEHRQLNGDQLGNAPMYVTPVWVGFLRLVQPAQFADENTDLDMTLIAQNSNMQYSSATTRQALKDYYEGKTVRVDGVTFTNNTHLGKRSFGGSSGNPLTEGSHGIGRNSYTVIKSEFDGIPTTTIKMNLWTQPKTMGYISGFSGSNPYEDYPRKAVIRIKATFRVLNEDGSGYDTKTVYEDVPVIQSRRLVNPKGVWRLSTNSEPFTFKLYQSEDPTTGVFVPLKSLGEWSAHISAGSGITLSPSGESRRDPNDNTRIVGDTDSEVTFQVNFQGGHHSAIVDVLYHGNSCIHKFYVRQGYDNPEEIVPNGAKWSCYSVYSFPNNPEFGRTGTDWAYVDLTVSPLALGTMFKKGNYTQGISIINNQIYGPLTAPGQNTALTLVNGRPAATWANIPGISRANRSGIYNTPPNVPTAQTDPTCTINGTNYNASTWTWAPMRVQGTGGTEDRKYRVPTYDDFQELLIGADIGVGVLYADGASEPQTSTRDAYGFFDATNTIRSSSLGMRGFFAYNSTTAKQVFFPIGTIGMGRRTMQSLQTPWVNWAGTLRYSAVTTVLDQANNVNNQFRPIPFNMPAVPGAIYWMAREGTGGYPGWDMNYFDLNFNAYDYAMSIGPGGDAVPIKLVLDERDE